jgi:hypothetical protein
LVVGRQHSTKCPGPGFTTGSLNIWSTTTSLNI